MTAFLDTSVTVPRFVDQSSSSKIIAWLAQLAEPTFVSSLVVGEFASAISRLTRMNEISLSFAEIVLAAFDAWVLTSLTLLEIEPDDIKLAAIFVRRFDLGLRMPDAIHAATCQRYRLRLVTFDGPLYRAACALGIDAIVPD